MLRHLMRQAPRSPTYGMRLVTVGQSKVAYSEQLELITRRANPPWHNLLDLAPVFVIGTISVSHYDIDKETLNKFAEIFSILANVSKITSSEGKAH